MFCKDDNSFIFTSLTEPFFTYLKLAFFSGIALASPVIIYQIWAFVAPGLYKHEKKYSVPFVLLGTLFFVTGVLFCFLVVFPIACTFFAGFAKAGMIEMKLKMSDYLSFSCTFLLAFGVVFELPIFILFLAKIGIVNHTPACQKQKIRCSAGICCKRHPDPAGHCQPGTHGRPPADTL